MSDDSFIVTNWLLKKRISVPMVKSKKISLTEESTHEDECVVGTRKGMRSDVDGEILLKYKKDG